MLVDVALDEQDAPRRVKPCGQQKGGDGDRGLRELFGVAGDISTYKSTTQYRASYGPGSRPTSAGPRGSCPGEGPSRLYTRENPLGGLCCCHDNAGYMPLGRLDGHYLRGGRIPSAGPGAPAPRRQTLRVPRRPPPPVTIPRVRSRPQAGQALPGCVGSRRGFRAPRPAEAPGPGEAEETAVVASGQQLV